MEEIREVNDQKLWDEQIKKNVDYTFLQSWNWGEFQKERGEKVYRVESSNGSCQFFTVSAKRGKFLFVPHATFVSKELLNYLKKTAAEEGCIFIRFSPWILESERSLKEFRSLGFKDAPTMMHAEETWLVPIDGTESEVFSRMRKTHRNLVRRAEKDGIIIERSGDIDILYKLLVETSKRHKFVPFSKAYLEKEWEVFSIDKSCELFVGKFDGEILAAAIIIFYGKFAFYYQSGSKETRLPVNYSLQWEVIKEAKKRGCEIYNMWGVAAENSKNSDGLFMFKSGFGGEAKKYMHAQDLVLSPKYYLTLLAEKIPRRWRNFGR